MSGNVIELHPNAPQSEFEAIDTSLANTAKRSVILGYKLSSLFLSHTIGHELPGVRNPNRTHIPERHVELKPDQSIKLTTEAGSQHIVDTYGLDTFYDEEPPLSPLLVIMPLSLPHNKGFQAPVIDAISKHANQQGRPVIVISSEGFSDKCLGISETVNLDFDKMTDNINEILDLYEVENQVKIKSFLATGCSRGGTLSLLLASKEAAVRRVWKARPVRRIEGLIAVAPAGLRRLDTVKKKVKVLKQFGLNEPFHIGRKASGMEPEELRDYGRTLVESIFPFRALPAVGKTALLFLKDTPLENIGIRLDPDAVVSILTMQNDGITTPKHWKQELGHRNGDEVLTLPGHHVSIDSVGKVAQAVNRHLDQNEITSEVLSRGL